MTLISKVSAVTIENRSIGDEDRNGFDSFATRIPGFLMQEGKYLGVISCRGSSAGLDDYDFTSGTLHETAEDAMVDARTLMYNLKAKDGNTVW